MAEQKERLESYDSQPYTLFNPSIDAGRVSDRVASLDDVTKYIYQSLLDYQGKWITTDFGEFAIQFPNARYLDVGHQIRNITTGQFYVVSGVIDSNENIVQLSGPTAPALGDILELDEVNCVDFVSDYSQSYKDRPVTEWRDTIVFMVKRREPGTIGKHPFDPPTEIKPRIREYKVDPDFPDSHIQILGQWFDNLIQFDCWAKLNNRADSLISWFEEFMQKYVWVWKKNGVQEVLYWMRRMDEEARKWRNDLAVRSVMYYFRTETVTCIREYDLKQIDLLLSLSNAVPSGVGEALPASGITEIIDRSFSVIG